MSDIRCEAIGPVIEEDFVVTRVSEWDYVIALKGWALSARRDQCLPV